MAIALKAYLVDHPKVAESLDRGYSPQYANARLSSARQESPHFTNLAPAPRHAGLVSAGGSSNRMFSPSGRTDRWSPELLADLRQALGPSPEGGPRDAQTFEHLPAILHAIQPGALRDAIQCDALAKLEAQYVLQRRSCPPHSEINARLARRVTDFIRSSAPQLSETQVGWLAYHLSEAQHPEQLYDIAMRMHRADRPAVHSNVRAPSRKMVARPTESPSPHVLGQPIKQPPNPRRVQSHPVNVADHLDAGQQNARANEVQQLIATNVDGAGTGMLPLKQMHSLAKTLVYHVDQPVFQNAVILETIAKQANGRILNNLIRASEQALPRILSELTRRLSDSNVNIEDDQLREAVTALRQTVLQGSPVVKDAASMGDPEKSETRLLAFYMLWANSKPFDATRVAETLRRLPQPEQFLGVNTPGRGEAVIDLLHPNASRYSGPSA